jgi:hypothetical protein
MRVLGWVLAGALALTAPIGVQAASLGPGSYSMPNGWDGDWRRAPLAPTERRTGFATLVLELSSRRVGSLWRARGSDLLGLRSRERSL